MVVHLSVPWDRVGLSSYRENFVPPRTYGSSNDWLKLNQPQNNVRRLSGRTAPKQVVAGSQIEFRICDGEDDENRYHRAWKVIVFRRGRKAGIRRAGIQQPSENISVFLRLGGADSGRSTRLAACRLRPKAGLWRFLPGTSDVFSLGSARLILIVSFP